MSTYLQSVLNAFHDLLFLFSEEGIIKEHLSSSQREESMLPVEDFVGKHYRDVLPPQVSDKFERAIDHVNREGENYKFDYSIELDGKKLWYVAVISKVDHDDGIEYLGAVRDITERKNKERLLEGVLNTAPGGIMVFNAIRDKDDNVVDFEVSHVNDAVEQLTALKKDDFIGWKMTEMVPPGPRKTMMEQFRQVMKTRKPVEFDYLHEEDGETVWYHCKATKFRDGLVSSFQDITKQKENQQKLAESNKELKELNRQKDKLFSVIAHDLRNAVTGSSGAYELIFEDYDALSKEEIWEYLKLLRENNRNAVNLLEDLLQWTQTKFQKVRTDPEDLSLHNITRQVFQNVSSKAEEKTITLNNRVPDDLSLNSDANMLKTILRNLLSNAIKFSPENSKIIVNAVKKEEEAEISVTDEGIGMDEETLRKVLDKKTNYTSAGTRGEKGSGLGMDICIDFVETLGGELRAESEPGEGSTFTFSLPAGRETSGD